MYVYTFKKLCVMNNLLFSYWGEFQAHTLSALHTVMATKDYTPRPGSAFC